MSTSTRSGVFVAVHPYPPSTAGGRIVSPVTAAPATGGPDVLAPWYGFAVLVLYVVVTLVAAGITLRREDA